MLHFASATLAVLAAAAALTLPSVSAAPPMMQRRSSIESIDELDDLAQIQSRNVSSLAARDIQSPVLGLPGCNDTSGDPTWASGTSNYTDGEGFALGSDPDCDNKKKGDKHCWTDYFLIGTTQAYVDWYSAVGTIDCQNDTGSCTEMSQHLSSHCTSFDWSVSTMFSEKVGAIFEESVFTTSFTVGESASSCNTNSTALSCTWVTGGCHQIWATYLVTTVYGYKRRSCNTPTSNPSANMRNTPMRADGYYTRGMQDFSIPLPGIPSIECGGDCESAFTGNLPATPNGPWMVPWNSSAIN